MLTGDIDKQQPVEEVATEEGVSTEIDVGQFIQKIPQEKITSIVDTFSSLYDIKLSKEVNTEVYAIDSDPLSAYLSNPERIKDTFETFFGIKLNDFISEKEIQGIADNMNKKGATFGKHFGYINKVVIFGEPEKVETVSVVTHEIMHAISKLEGGGFRRNVSSFNDGSYVYKSTPLDEGATQLLTIGVLLGTTDLEKIKEEVEKQMERIVERLEEEGNQVPSAYLPEVWCLLHVLEEGNISMKELASAYIRGDAKYLVEQVSNNIAKIEGIDIENIDIDTVPKDIVNEYAKRVQRIMQSSEVLEVFFFDAISE